MQHHHLIYWIVLGLIAGAIGSRLVNNRGSGLVLDTIIGVVGAVLGGYVSEALGLGGINGYGFIWSLFVAVAGSVIVLLGYRAVANR